jgi:hypothetical protein
MPPHIMYNFFAYSSVVTEMEGIQQMVNAYIQ